MGKAAGLTTFFPDYYACPHNILAHEPTKWVWVLAAYVMLQVAILMIQDIWDPRFFVPERVSSNHNTYKRKKTGVTKTLTHELLLVFA